MVFYFSINYINIKINLIYNNISINNIHLTDKNIEKYTKLINNYKVNIKLFSNFYEIAEIIIFVQIKNNHAKINYIEIIALFFHFISIVKVKNNLSANILIIQS